MKKYIVGGFCRDKIMGLKPNDKDYVLVGCNERDIQRLLEQGFSLVGKSFPVYLSPGGEEHALARTERKEGSGYNGFVCSTEGVSLEDDLKRRDLTINAIAWDPVLKRYIDPCGGQKDIQAKVLRHVSSAFAEDPLRVLRLARFGARFSDFTIHKDTLELVDKIVKSGEMDTLTPERVSTEFLKAMQSPNFSKFLEYLDKFKVLRKLIPKFDLTNVIKNELNAFENNCTEAYKEDFFWSTLLKNVQFKPDHSYGSLKLKSSTTSFVNKISKIEARVRTFRTLNPEDMTVLMNEIGAKHNGGEEYIVKLLEYFVITKAIDIDLEHLIMLVYDKHNDTKVPDIEAMVKAGVLLSKDVSTYVNNLRTESISSLFKN